MNYSNKPINNSGLNVLKTGGTLNLVQRLKGLLNWKVGVGIVIGLILIIVAYYTYKQYSDKTNFHANRENIPKDQSSNKTATLMLFYVDWCPHCKTAKPVWDDLKSEYENKTINGYTIVFTEINCTTESNEVEKMMDKYNVEGFPTIKLLKDGQIIEYDAKPTRETLNQFLNTVLN
jgi:thiol-disulfide isomerase/thioredoxin